MSFRHDAEACGKCAIEVIERPRPHIWRHMPIGSPEELEYLIWVTRWAAHWARLEMSA